MKIAKWLFAFVVFLCLTTAYVTHVEATMPRPTITMPGGNTTVAYDDLTITGTNAARARVYVSLRDITTNSSIFERREAYDSFGNTNWVLFISQSYLTPGREYRLTAFAKLDGLEVWTNPSTHFFVDFPPPTFHEPVNGASHSLDPIEVSGTNPSGGQMYIFVRNLTTNTLVIDNQFVPYSRNSSYWAFTIPKNRLTPGHRYSVSIVSVHGHQVRGNHTKAWVEEEKQFSITHQQTAVRPAPAAQPSLQPIPPRWAITPAKPVVFDRVRIMGTSAQVRGQVPYGVDDLYITIWDITDGARIELVNTRIENRDHDSFGHIITELVRGNNYYAVVRSVTRSSDGSIFSDEWADVYFTVPVQPPVMLLGTPLDVYNFAYFSEGLFTNGVSVDRTRIELIDLGTLRSFYINWSVSRHYHTDWDPWSLYDTQVAQTLGTWGSWAHRPGLLRFPSGQLVAVGFHLMPHGASFRGDNGLDGHMCMFYGREGGGAIHNMEGGNRVALAAYNHHNVSRVLDEER